MASKLKVLIYDIETAPAKVYRWSASQDFIPPNMVIHDTSMLTWAAKWRGEKRIYSDAIDTHEAVKADDERIVLSLADLVREADIVVAHNGEKFDLPKLNGYVLNNRAEPLGPVKTIDTLKLARKNFGMQSHSLDYLAGYLGLGRKIKTDFDLWKAIVEDGDIRAIRKMLRYNRKDVILLEEVFETMLPYVTGVPRLTDPDRYREVACPYCGSVNVMKRGIRRTVVSNFQQYQCLACLKYSSFWQSDKNKPGLKAI